MERAKRYLVNALILSGCTLLMRTVGVAFNAFCVDRVGAEGMQAILADGHRFLA